TPHMALTYHGELSSASRVAPARESEISTARRRAANLWIWRAWLTFFRSGSASLARCAGHRGIARSGLDGDQDRPRHGLRDPHRRRDGLAPPRAYLLGRRRLRARGSVVGQRRLLPGAARPEPPVQARRRGPLRQPLAALRGLRRRPGVGHLADD